MLVFFLNGSLGFLLLFLILVMFGLRVFCTSQESGCEDPLWNDLLCVDQDAKPLYSIQLILNAQVYIAFQYTVIIKIVVHCTGPKATGPQHS